jgi:thiol-disulfide isomerase/thioredoxin
MNRLKHLTLAALVAVCAMAGMVAAHATEPRMAGAAMGATPSLKGETLTGKPFDLAAQKGKVTLVAFWATWCPTCRHEIPQFRKLVEELRGQGFELVLVSIDDDRNDVEDYVRVVMKTTNETQSFPMLWRKQAGLADSFGNIRGTPSTYLIDRAGKVVATTRGALKPADYAAIRTQVAAR